jgi:purine-binding chemotaxis protein CheW
MGTILTWEINMKLAEKKLKDLDADESADQYLTFTLAGEEYGVDILSVQEVKVWSGVTALPNTPGYILGVLNLRGAIVPIVDLRKRFGIEAVEFDDTTVIVVLKLEMEQESKIIGVVVDTVSDVLDIPHSAQKPVDGLELNRHSEAITGVAALNNKLVIMLNATKLLGENELNSLEKALPA